MNVPPASTTKFGGGDKKVFDKQKDNPLTPRYDLAQSGHLCDICKKLPAHRHYNHYFVCSPCFIDLYQKDKKSKTSDKVIEHKASPQFDLDRWIQNQPSEGKITGGSNIAKLLEIHDRIIQTRQRGGKEEGIFNETELLNPSVKEKGEAYQEREKRLIGVSKIHHIKPAHPEIPSSYIKCFKDYECEEEAAINIYPKVKIVAGNPYYEEAKGYSAASSSYHKLRNFVERYPIEGKEKGVYLCKLVLTFPMELSEYYYQKGENKRPWELFKKFWVRLQEEFCIADEDREIREKMGGVVNLHPWSTREPMVPHYHFHASFLNVVSRASSTTKEEETLFGGASKVEGRRLSPMIDGGILKWLKEKWRVLLEEEGRAVFGEDYELKSVDVYYDFVKMENKGKVLHSLKYQYRQWVVDFCNWTEKVEYWGEMPRAMERYKNKARVYGFWKELGSDKETEEELRSGKKKICPFCEAITNKIGEETPEDIWKKEKNGELEWYEFDKGKLKKATAPTELFFSYMCLPEGVCEAPSMKREYEELPSRAQRLVDDMCRDKKLLAKLMMMEGVTIISQKSHHHH